MAELGRIQPIKRPTPEAAAQLPGHIQEKLKDPTYDIRKDPEAMSHLMAHAMGGGFAKVAQDVANASAQARGVGGPPQAQEPPGVQRARQRTTQPRLALPSRMSSDPGAPRINWGATKAGAPPPPAPGTPLQTAQQIAMGSPQAKKRMQARQPIGGPQQPLAGQPAPMTATGPSFKMRGIGRYYNPSNVQGQQFNKPAVKQTVEKGLNAVATASFYRRAGVTEGVRGFLGLPPTPSHMNDWIRAGHNQNITGINPQAMHF